MLNRLYQKKNFCLSKHGEQQNRNIKKQQITKTNDEQQWKQHKPAHTAHDREKKTMNFFLFLSIAQHRVQEERKNTHTQ